MASIENITSSLDSLLTEYATNADKIDSVLTDIFGVLDENTIEDTNIAESIPSYSDLKAATPEDAIYTRAGGQPKPTIPVKGDGSKTEQAWSLIRENLDLYGTVEGKHHYLQNAKVSSKKMPIGEFIQQFEGLQDTVNTYMSDLILANFGNPATDSYTLSQETSDRDLLKSLDNLEVDQKWIEENFSNDELISLENARLEKNIKDALLTKDINNIKTAIKLERERFDKPVWGILNPAAVGSDAPLGVTGRMKPAANVGGVFYNLISGISKLSVQGLMGWSDWGREDYEDIIENRWFNFNPELRMSGKAFEDAYIHPLQSDLKGKIAERTNLMYDYKDEDDAYDEYFDRQKSIQENRTLINATGLDEALHYMDLENLKEILR